MQVFLLSYVKVKHDNILFSLSYFLRACYFVLFVVYVVCFVCFVRWQFCLVFCVCVGVVFAGRCCVFILSVALGAVSCFREWPALSCHCVCVCYLLFLLFTQVDLYWVSCFYFTVPSLFIHFFMVSVSSRLRIALVTCLR